MSTLKLGIVLGMMGLLLSASTSLAGGSKNSTTIKVVNQSTYVVLVTTNPNSAAIQAALANGSLTEFIAAGGKQVNAGSSVSFSVSAGNITLAADAVNSTGSGLLGYIEETKSVSAGSTTTIYVVPSSASQGIAFSSTSM